METNTTNKPDLSEEVVGALADAFKKSFTSIKRWIEADDERLRYDERAKRVFDKYGIAWN